MAVISHRHKPGDLKQTEMYSLTYHEAACLKQNYAQGYRPSLSLREGAVLTPFPSVFLTIKALQPLMLSSYLSKFSHFYRAA